MVKDATADYSDEAMHAALDIPVVALLIGVFLVGDSIHPLGYAAMILILSGVAVLQLGSRRAPVEISSPRREKR